MRYDSKQSIRIGILCAGVGFGDGRERGAAGVSDRSVGETTVTLHVGQRIDGLFYRVVAATELGGEWTPVTEFRQAADFTVDRKATDTSAFYKIEVSDVGESVP